MSSSSSKHEAHVYHRSQWRLLQYLFIFLSIHANISLQDSSLPPGSKDDQICSSASLSSLHGASAPRIVIVHPTNGEIVTDYRGGGRGMQIFIRYEVQDLPCGGSSRILLVKDEIPMETMPLPGDLATAAVVDVFFRLTPGHYRLLVVVQDRAGHEKARESVSLEVEVPDYARHVRVMGTHDTLAAILGAILKNRSGAYLRFGDGDIQLSSGLGGAEQMQAADTALMFEAQAALAMQGEHVFKGLMVNSELFGGIEEGMCDGNHLISDEIALGIVEMASPFWKPAPISDVYGNAALAHAAATYPELAVDFLVQLRRARPVAFVGNLNVEPALLHALFGRQVVHIKSPPTQAYSQLDRIHAELLQVLGEAGGGAAGTGDTRMHVVVTFMGTSGLVLQHRLRHLNLFTFDFGSLLDGKNSATSAL